MYDYLDFGIPHIWILDPVLRRAYVYTRAGWAAPPEDAELTAPPSTIVIRLTELFREME